MRLSDALAIKVGAANAVAVYAGSVKVWPVVEAAYSDVWAAVTMPPYSGYPLVLDETRGLILATNASPSYRTSDAGRTWAATTLPNATFIGGMRFDANHCIALTNSSGNSSYLSGDAGQTWTAVNLPAIFLRPGPVFSSTRGLAVSSTNGASYLTTDAGQTWALSTLPNGVYNASVVFSATRAVVFGSTSYLTTDAGQTWTAVTVGGGVAASMVFDASRAMALVSAGTPSHVTEDGGQTWAVSTLPDTRYYAGVVFDAVHGTVFGGDNGVSYLTDDAGRTWRKSSLPQGNYPYAMRFSSTRALAIGANSYGTLTPAITLAINLPAPKVGVAYTGSITATNVDGATGAITITATPLPAGLSVGTVVANGDGSYTLPITGTPTTAQSVDVGISATNGPQSASATQTLVVTAPATGLAPVAQNSVALAAIPASFTVPLNQSAPTTPAHAGALLTAAWTGYSSRTPTTDASWANQGTITQGSMKIVVFTKVSDGTETGITFAQAASGSLGCGGAVVEWPVGATGAVSFNQSSFTSGSLTTPTAGFARAITTPAPPKPASVPCIFYGVQTQPATISPSSPWVGAYKNTATLDGSVGYCYEAARDTVDTVILTRDTSTNTNNIAWANIWISQ